jgi:threonine synthase
MADFREATLRGQPGDAGLFFPEQIPHLGKEFLAEFRGWPKERIAFEIIRPYVGETVDDDTLWEICRETVDFDFPLVPVGERVHALELFHGPTLAFKDVGARFMSRCLRYFTRERGERTLVIVATSGDTGGAVAAGFHGAEGVDVVILYPKGKVSRVQELQLTTLGGNVTAFAVDGVFDDCQAIAKRLLADADVNANAFVTSANSINIARWLPQQFYYFFALAQTDADAPVFSVPSGNFGNICAGLLAHASGMPAGHFIAACNANAVVPDFMRTQRYEPRRSVATLSNAMDVGAPSNFVRVLEIFDNEFPRLAEILSAASVSDDETVATMRKVFDGAGYVLDPHGAVAYKALADHLARNPGRKGIFLETAHPVKFDSVRDILGTFGDVPDAVRELETKAKVSVAVPADAAVVKEVILSKL